LAFTVYVLKSATCGKRYIGQTEDLERRLQEHNSHEHNLRKFNSRFPGPWILAHVEEFSSRSEAMKRERWLKSGAGRGWLDELNGGATPPVAD
jgi:putative endonuclease